MKCAKLRRRQCSMMVVMILLAAALLFSFAANATPRGADEAVRGTGKSGTEVTRLVTGDPAQINAVVAGGPWPPTAILAVNPVAVPAGVTPPNPYPPGTTIVGNELRAEVGGFRAWFEFQFSDWDPNGDGFPPIGVVQVKIDATGYMGVNAIPSNAGVDLAPAIVACTTGAECIAAFGENWTKCESEFCRYAYANREGTGRPDSWCADTGFGHCTHSDCSAGSFNTTCFAVYPDARPDDGTVKYLATLVLDIPADTRGKYTVNLNTDATFIACLGCPPGIIETLAESGFTVNIVIGQCCFGFGTPEEGCIDGVLPSECGDDEPPPFIFIPEGLCPPQGLDCRGFLGACCDTRDGSCEDWQPNSSCRGTYTVWTSGVTCDEVACVADPGACCDTLYGQCEDQVFEFYCQGTHRIWSRNTSCNDAECTSQTGACCHGDPFGPCTDDTVLSDCRCPTCTWYKLQSCAETDCALTPIPTVSEWGLAILTLLLLTAAKVYFGRRAGEPRLVTPHRDHLWAAAAYSLGRDGSARSRSRL